MAKKKKEGRNGVDLLPPRERTKAATDPLPVTVKSRKTGKIDKYKTRDMNIYNEYFKRTKASVKVPKIDMGKAEKQERAEYEKPGFEGPSRFIRGMAGIDRTLSRIAVGQVVDTNIQKRARGAKTGLYFRRHGPRKQKK